MLKWKSRLEACHWLQQKDKTLMLQVRLNYVREQGLIRSTNISVISRWRHKAPRSCTGPCDGSLILILLILLVNDTKILRIFLHTSIFTPLEQWSLPIWFCIGKPCNYSILLRYLQAGSSIEQLVVLSISNKILMTTSPLWCAAKYFICSILLCQFIPRLHQMNPNQIRQQPKHLQYPGFSLRQMWLFVTTGQSAILPQTNFTWHLRSTMLASQIQAGYHLFLIQQILMAAGPLGENPK